MNSDRSGGGASADPLAAPGRIAFLHTSRAHIATFERLVRDLDPEVRIHHVVAEDLLADAQVVGVQDADLVARIRKAMDEAGAAGAAVVACTCSTIGGVAERTPTGGRYEAVRIDRAMAEQAVRAGNRILVVAALASTLAPTVDLVRESAAALRKEVTIGQRVVEDAWRHFLSGDREVYVAAIAAAVRDAAIGTDVVVLAQASMAPAADRLQDLGVPVLSSPALGVQAVLDRLRAPGPRSRPDPRSR